MKSPACQKLHDAAQHLLVCDVKLGLMHEFHEDMNIIKFRSRLLGSAKENFETARTVYNYIRDDFEEDCLEEVLGGVIETREQQERKRRRTAGGNA
jgi:hypothetical protein